jgi:hypothetical protein
VDGLAAAARSLAGCRHLYLCLNPAREDLGAEEAASDEDVLSRRWLFIDLDPVKAVKDDCASDQEKAACLAAGETLLTSLSESGWPEPVVVDSGNGCYLLYRVELPNDEGARELCRGVLHALAGLCGDGAKVDRSVHNASRIARLPGTWNRKGTATLERPHRLCRLLHVPEGGPQVVSRELLEALAAPAAAVTPEHPPGERHSPFRGTPASGRLDAYCRRLLAEEVLSVAMAARGERNNVLNEAAFALGTVLSWGVLDEAEVTELLAEAALRAGLEAAEIGPTIQSGMGAGRKLPRPLPVWAQPAQAAPAVPAAPAVSTAGTQPVVVCLADVEPRRVTWLWPDWLPHGSLCVLDGDPGLGKSSLTLELAARLSRGEALPPLSGPNLGTRPTATLLLGAEDALDYTVRPRLDAMGADCSLIHSLEAFADGITGEERPVQLPADLGRMEAFIRERGVALVVVDPLMAYLGSEYDAHKDQDVRRCLRPLAQLAGRTGCVVLLVRHLNKLHGGPALYRGGSSIGITGAARASMIAGRDPDEDRFVLAMNKLNVGPKPTALAYRLEGAGLACRIVWDGEVDLRPDQILGHGGAGRRQGRPPDALAEAMEFLRSLLAFGRVTTVEVNRQADARGISRNTLARARADLGVIPTREGNTYYMELPLQEPPSTAEGEDTSEQNDPHDEDG